MKTLFLFAFLYPIYSPAIAQKCPCPSDSNFGNQPKPLKTFTFSGKQTIGLCGDFEKTKHDTIYSECSLYICGQPKAIGEWGALEPFKIRKQKDTLFVDDLYYLPTGKNLAEVQTTFYIHKFFFKNSQLQEVDFFRKGVRLYNKKEIAQVLNQYKGLSKGNSDHTIEVANRLFWAYVSGSKQAEIYFTKIEEKFGPFDGAIAEEWDDIWATYLLWKKNNL